MWDSDQTVPESSSFKVASKVPDVVLHKRGYEIVTVVIALENEKKIHFFYEKAKTQKAGGVFCHKARRSSMIPSKKTPFDSREST